MGKASQALIEGWLALTGRDRRVGTSGDGLRVVLYGTLLGHHWRNSLYPRSVVWRSIPSVTRVTVVPERFGGTILDTVSADTVVIPLTEIDIRRCPPRGRRLAPTPDTVDVYGDKRRFAAFVTAERLDDVAAADIPLSGPIPYPCALKRLDLRNGKGVALIDSPASLEAHLARSPWRDHDVVLQAWIDGRTEFVTHLVCDAGRILWHRTYRYELAEGTSVRTSKRAGTTTRTDIDAQDLADMARFLEPTGYSGPCNVNFKRAGNGRIVVFEINPRFGGSLMRPSNRGDLAEALAVIVAHARQPTESTAAPIAGRAQAATAFAPR